MFFSKTTETIRAPRRKYMVEYSYRQGGWFVVSKGKSSIIVDAYSETKAKKYALAVLNNQYTLVTIIKVTKLDADTLPDYMTISNINIKSKN